MNLTSRFTLVGLVLALALTAMVAPAAGQTPAEDDSSEATKIMIVGDSITQGSVGDYTWRYFAWHHLLQTDAEVDFVGPSQEVHVEPWATWSPSHADPRFDRHHAATWGDRLVYDPLHDRAALIDVYAPDVVVLALGVNDLRLGWSVKLTVKAVRTWVGQTRLQRPETDFVLVEVPGSPLRKAARFNRQLAKAAKKLNRSKSRVTVARASVGFRLGRGYRRNGHTYDAYHPNTSGQVRIAAAVADGLARVGVGESYARPLAAVREGPRVRPVLRVAQVPRGARLSWSVPPGATGFDVFVKPRKKAWRRIRLAQPQAVTQVRGLHPCRTYAFKVRARKGWTLAATDMTSRVRRVQATANCA